MREICSYCDEDMRLLNPPDPNPDVLVWVCVNAACVQCGEWVVEPNWGKWFPSLKLTPGMITDQTSTPIEKRG